MNKFIILAMIGLAILAGVIGAPVDGQAALLDPGSAMAVGLGGLIVNRSNLGLVFTGYKTSFNKGFSEAMTKKDLVATTVPSTTSEEKYGWLGKVPGMRKWLGDRVVNSIKLHDYAIKNDDFEDTIGVDRNEIEDDSYGVYAPLFEEMGRAVAAHPDELVWPLLAAGFSGACYDGQYFFDTDHPVLDENGAVTSVANTDGGSGTAWYLMDDSRAIKPIIFQQRKKADFVAKDDPTDDAVFKRREFQYGVHARDNVGYGFWQFIWGSKQTLDATHYAAGRVGLQEMKGDYGRPLGLNPRKLVVPPSLEEKANTIVGAKELAGGGDNPWYGTAEVVVVPWLA